MIPSMRITALVALIAVLTGSGAAAQSTSATSLLLIPDTTNDRIMAFDATTGDLLDANFIGPDPTHIPLAFNAILSPRCDSILVADPQLDVVQEFDLFGTYRGVFAPAGGADTTIVEANFGITLNSSSNLLVTVAGGPNADAVAEFDPSGSYLGNVIPPGIPPISHPFDVIAVAGGYYVSSSSPGSTPNVSFVDTSGSIVWMKAIGIEPRQIKLTASGNILVANTSGLEQGILELEPVVGNVVGMYQVPTLPDYRGVHELPNGHLLVTSSSGVHEIDRANNLIRTIVSGVVANYIERVDLAFATSYGSGCPGSGGLTPELSMRGCPALGNRISLDITLGLGGATAVYFSGLAAASAPAFGCTLLVQPPLLLPVTILLGGSPGLAGDGSFQLPIDIPVSPGLSGRTLFTQAAVIDSGAIRGIAFTNGLTYTVQ